MGALVALGLASVLAGSRTGVPRVPTDAANIVSQSYAGHVHAASGYRTTASGNNEKRQMDWALLRVPKARHLTNMVVTYGEISPYADTIPYSHFLEFLAKALNSSSWVDPQGRRGGFSLD
ncbi:hypothetical protein TEQG_05995 [Trichophyton equinum CBS 127.97]|uniref:Uncharacterized protein n=1 Tax=Trichophyton equinum (strain ATCC MYA-4606 / CBS 127.97) TaxID=559882 RepID=F2PYH4_TRIEC|nr:hypothetical protein TEQG_05995 [Trichophyton equinum CBS 127.97]